MLYLFTMLAGCNNKTGTEQHNDNNDLMKQTTTHRILYIVRHAKSSWKDASLSDFERPLKKRGVKDAHIIGELLVSKSVQPDLIISSPANRAISTANILTKEIFSSRNQNIKEKIITDKEIYEASLSDLRDIIEQFNDSLQTVMIIGHNPSFTQLANYLTEEYFENIPTCGVVAVNFNISSWKMIKKYSGKLLFYEYPKKYRK